MAKYTIEIDGWVNMELVAPIVQLIEIGPRGVSPADETEFIEAIMDAQDGVSYVIDQLSDYWAHHDCPPLESGFDLEKWSTIANCMERLAKLIRQGLAEKG